VLMCRSTVAETSILNKGYLGGGGGFLRRLKINDFVWLGGGAIGNGLGLAEK
jgi:hypothetical protein